MARKLFAFCQARAGSPPLGATLLACSVALLAGAAAAEAWRWDNPGQTGGPGPRYAPLVIWTGRELLIWGGKGFETNAPWRDDGWRYDSRTGGWRPMSAAGSPEARQFPAGVWTGRELVVWGGHTTHGSPDSLRTGARYDPAADAWKPTSLTGAPAKRGEHTMTWTGAEVIVWGGYNFASGEYRNDGGRYDPLTDSWTGLASDAAPSRRSGHTAVWTGEKLIVWGGGRLEGGIGNLRYLHRADYGLYDPAADRWEQGQTAGAPAARSNHAAVWTGREMLVWGGWNGERFEQRLLADGALFRPSAASWSALSPAGAPEARAFHLAAWTGWEMLIWGGDAEGPAQSGGRYDPERDTWSALPTEGSPSGGSRQSGAWNGEAFHVYHDRLALAYATGPYALDGIPDEWQRSHFGPQNPAGAAAADPDADAQNNTFEYLAATVPTDPRSRLSFELRPTSPEGGLLFEISPAYPGRRYRVERSPGTSPLAWSFLGDAWTDEGDDRWTLSAPRPAAAARLYRLGIAPD